MMTKTPEPPGLLSMTCGVKGAATLLGVSVGTIYNFKKDPKYNFPPPAPLSLRSPRFLVSDIKKYAQYGAMWDQA